MSKKHLALIVMTLMVGLGLAVPARAAAPEVSSGTLVWGVKKSFRSYIEGPIAHGAITTTDGATRTSTGELSFGSGTGTTPNVSFTGSAHFTGHSGALDVTLSDPKIVTSGSTGSLSVLTTRPGQAAERVVIADLGQVATTGSDEATTLTASATLTSAGEQVFALDGSPFYPAGTELDPISLSLSHTPDVPEPTPTPNPTPDPTATPSPEPTQPATPDLPAASLAWGIKSSFRSYVTGPIARGSVAVSGHARSRNGVFIFPQRSTTAKPPKSIGTTRYRGGVRFTGHHGELDMTIGNPRVVVTSNSRADLVVDHTSGGRTKSVVVSHLDLGPAKNARAATFTNVPVTLTEAGTALFRYDGRPMYPAGTAMDPVTFSIGGNARVSGSGDTTVVSTTSTTSAARTAVVPETVAPAALPANACVATGRALSWGVKESFRAYVSGTIANGSWSTSGGATYATPEFGWPKGTGRMSQKTRAGSITFPGTIRFTGHDGALDTRIANPQIRLNGQKATLVVDLTSASREAAMEGRSEVSTWRNVALVDIDLTSATSAQQGPNTTLMVTDASTSLTAGGSAAFSDYPAGTSFDPISFTISSPSSCLATAPATTLEETAAAPAPVAATVAGAEIGWKPWLGSAAVGAVIGSLFTLLGLRLGRAKS